jgi:radical SAM family uncharacterized protein
LKFVNPLKLFGDELCSVQNPATYIGGESGQIKKIYSENDDLLNFAIAFPDLYEIGMSNQAIKIIYNGLNALSSVRCERVFAPEKDFEDLLKYKSASLYTLESGMELNYLDIIGFSIGYELGITGVLSILDLGKIPLLRNERSEHDPIIIAGGCGATNPAVFSDFFDAFFIGEAEPELFKLVAHLAALKRSGATRMRLLQEMASSPFVWTENMSEQSCGHAIARRAIQNDFGKVPSISSFYPLPLVKPVQDHGVIEIMRGCPNGCRFCHAGIYYRPQRIKPVKLIVEEADHLITEGGYRQISLTSLSSGDYPGIDSLLNILNSRYAQFNVSFQLPSLKVNSFTLPILEKLSEVRKSGLTFAIETPEEAWQLRLNKEVYAQHLVEIINEAKARGWNKAKFYFMVGLPFPETAEKSEESVIVDFLIELQKRTKIQCNVNIGTFIPKPHTPYQWVRQISPEESDKKLSYIRQQLPRGKFHVSTHDINTSFIEGLVSRGDKRTGDVILNAYKKGCRLDAWDDHIRNDLPFWKEAFNEAAYDVTHEILRERQLDETLPWDTVSLGPSKAFFRKEWEKNLKEELTPRCEYDCSHRCGICNDQVSVSKIAVDITHENSNTLLFIKTQPENSINLKIVHRAIFSFSKKNGGEFISHLSQVEIFNRAILSSGLPIFFTTGFNPLPRLEFATTLSLGISSLDEIGSLILYEAVEPDYLIHQLNKYLSNGIQLEKCFVFSVTNQRKRESLAAALWGSKYLFHFKKYANPYDYINSDLGKTFMAEHTLDSFTMDTDDTMNISLVFNSDKLFRESISTFYDKPLYTIVKIVKTHTFAKSAIIGWTDLMDDDYRKSIETENMSDVNKIFRDKVLHPENSSATKDVISYFDLYQKIADINAALIKRRNERQ